MKTRLTFLFSGWLAAFLFIWLPSACIKAALPYSSGSTGADGPLQVASPVNGARYLFGLAYDTARQKTVLAGGTGTAPYRETWTWDGTTWSQLQPSNQPLANIYLSVAYDSIRQLITLFGGRNNNINNDFAETWTWNGATWLQVFPSSSPSGRYDAAFAFDSVRQKSVLFGGISNGARVGDTWLWDGASWAQVNPSSSPSARDQATMVFDAARQETVLFGGYASGYSDETWTWDGANWSLKTPVNRPAARGLYSMSYDPVSQRVLLFGGNTNAGTAGDFWAWDGTNWTPILAQDNPIARYGHAMVYDSARQRTVLYGGYNNSLGYLNDTWLWDGTKWQATGGTVQIDMNDKPNGVWNYTMINIPTGATVTFKNANSTPVRWLATGKVSIGGTVNLDGANGNGTPLPGNEAKGGPGGFPGGLGGIKASQSGRFSSSPGGGPGGGAGATDVPNSPGSDGVNTGNIYAQPLIGGSGGSGGGSNNGNDGGNGGGGGGALLISSSDEINVTGSLFARGGSGGNNGAANGGAGAGGTIRLVAGRVIGNGRIDAGTTGRARIEAYDRNFIGGIFGQSAQSAPVAAPAAVANGIINVTSVAGSNVLQPPTGNTGSPDVTFTAPGAVTVTVTATGLPDGTPVNLRITTQGAAAINLPATGDPTVVLQGGVATFTATVPAGVGTIQATAVYTVPN